MQTHNGYMGSGAIREATKALRRRCVRGVGIDSVEKLGGEVEVRANEVFDSYPMNDQPM